MPLDRDARRVGEWAALSQGRPAGLWLFGPAADLLFGCGLLYVLLFVLLAGSLGIHAGAHGELDVARREFLRSLELQESAPGWVGLAHAEFHAGRREQAHAALLRAVNLEPDDVDVWVRASEVWAALGDRLRAGGALVRALALDPKRDDLAQRLRELRAARSPPHASPPSQR